MLDSVRRSMWSLVPRIVNHKQFQTENWSTTGVTLMGSRCQEFHPKGFLP